MAGTTGLEPATSDVTGRRSNQLNYVPASGKRFHRSTATAPGPNPLNRFPILAKNCSQPIGNLAHCRVRLRRFEDQWHQVITAPGCLLEPFELISHLCLVARHPNRSKSIDLRLFQRRVESKSGNRAALFHAE